MDCPGCKKHAPADAVFCPHCGLGLAGTRACPGCGVALAPWEHPCPHCGTRTQTSSDAAPEGMAAQRPPSREASRPVPDADEASDYETLVEAGRSADRRLLAGIGVAVIACAAAFYLMRDVAADAAPVVAEAPLLVERRLAASPPAPEPPARPQQEADAAPAAEPPIPDAYLRPAEAQLSLPSDADVPPPQAQLPPASEEALPPVARPTPLFAADTQRPACKTRRTQTASSTSAPAARKAVQASARPAPKAPVRVAATPRPRPARVAPNAAAARSGTEAVGWEVALRSRIAVCERRPFVERTVCREKARWKYCSPSRWNKSPECALTTQASN